MTGVGAFASLRNGTSLPLRDLPELALEEFRRAILDATAAGCRVSALFASPGASFSPVQETGSGIDLELYAVLADPRRGLLRAARSRPEPVSWTGENDAEADGYRSMTPDCPQVHLFEREMAEQYGVRPEGHPWFKPVRFHACYRPGADAWGRPAGTAPGIGVTDFYRVEGEEVHEVAVGPVHAGVIEPGHFRFQCHGEEVFHLEISLGYQHRGLERMLIGGPDKRTIHLMETVAGDTSVGHATAYSLLVEALGGCTVPARAEVLRGVALELERLANHTGDLGALAGDVAFLPTASWCGRLRGDFLNLTASLCGSRFGRGMIRPGGVGFDLEPGMAPDFRTRLDAALRDVRVAAELMFESSSVQARFEGTGSVSREVCDELGLVGPAARACGAETDVRQDFPWGVFRFAQGPTATWTTGDVFARAYVRWLEIQHSVEFIHGFLEAFPDGPVRTPPAPPRPDHFAASLVEGWRGEICHVALTDAQGRFRRYKIVDPSFHNWMGLAVALRGQQISDFPLCNKSFNLSYCGHDL
jgi:Ni,Fe-hydrogenase III large subunit